MRPGEAGWERERGEREGGGGGERETERLSREGELNSFQSASHSSSEASLWTHTHHMNSSSRLLPPESLLRAEGIRTVIFLFSWTASHMRSLRRGLGGRGISLNSF